MPLGDLGNFWYDGVAAGRGSRNAFGCSGCRVHPPGPMMGPANLNSRTRSQNHLYLFSVCARSMLMLLSLLDNTASSLNSTLHFLAVVSEK